MWINTPNARLALAGRRGLRLKDARGTRLRAVQGTLWVTIDHDLRDVVLDAGESFVVDSDRPLMVMALGACATVDVKGPAESAQRSKPGWLPAWWPQLAGAITPRA